MSSNNLDMMQEGETRLIKLGNGVTYLANKHGIHPVRDGNVEQTLQETAPKPEPQHPPMPPKLSAKTRAEMEGGRRALERIAERHKEHGKPAWLQPGYKDPAEGSCNPVVVPSNYVQPFDEQKQHQEKKTLPPKRGRPGFPIAQGEQVR